LGSQKAAVSAAFVVMGERIGERKGIIIPLEAIPALIEPCQQEKLRNPKKATLVDKICQQKRHPVTPHKNK